MRRALQIADDLFFDVGLCGVMAGGAFFFGHLVWGALFALSFVIDLALKGHRILRERIDNSPKKQAAFDEYFAKPS